jgi:dipeptidase D
MERILSSLEPKSLWNIFEDFCNIPHPSKKEEQIVAYVKKFGEDLGLETQVDSVGNVLIRKPATAGHKNRMTVILQSHLDMVPQKNNDTVHDFEQDPLKVYIDQEWVKAEGTTLGADNGIGAAAALAVLQDPSIEHGPLECLFTVDEETGMTGAFALKDNMLMGDILINLDSEDEGELYIGCAGGIDTTAKFPYKTVNVVGSSQGFDIIVKGLKGGHSGLDIHLGRGNANKILNRILWQANRELLMQLAYISGGSLRNAIPREAVAKVVVPMGNAKKFEKLVEEFTSKIKTELRNVEPELEIIVKFSAVPDTIIDPEVTKRLLSSLYACPNGAMRMVDDMPDVVETSTNLAIVKLSDGIVEVNSLQRSAVDSAKDDLCNMIRSVFELAGAEVEHTGSYPGWKPDLDSPILQTMKTVYNGMYGKIPQVKVIHAGLECGILGGIYTNLDMISFGPTIRNPHSPDEKVNIKTVAMFWDFLLETLKNIPEK